MTWRGPEAELAETGLDFPTLGITAWQWIEENCVIPDGDQLGEPLRLTDEMVRFLVHYYRVEPTGRSLKWSGPRFHYARGGQLVRPQKWGKALALDTPVPTPTGWSTMAQIGVGSHVLDEHGQVCRVVAKSPVWMGADCFAVSFSDGERVVANADHLWTVEDRQSEYAEKTLDTATLFDLGVLGWTDERRWRIRMPAPLDLPPVDLPLDPYTLGAWLGDGETAGQRITGLDQEVFEQVTAAGFRLVQTEPKRWSVYGLRQHLRAAGVYESKHIPTAYLRASAPQRLALLQGLMDTDGYVDDRGHCEFVTTRPALADGFGELLATFGIKYGVREGSAKLYGRVTGPKWRFLFTVHDSLPVFRLTRKLARLRPTTHARDRYRSRHIVSIERVESVPTACITVDSPSSLFLVGRRMVPTHNSPFSAAVILFEAMGPALPDGWDADGTVVGRPWPTPHIQITAVSSDQTANVYRALMPMIRFGPLDAEMPDAGLTRINLPNGGLIEPVTASAMSRLGQRVTAVIHDETHGAHANNGGKRLADNQRRNLSGMGGRFIETTNAWSITEDSVAQDTFENPVGVYVDYPPPIGGSVRNKAERRKAMRHAYGDSVRNGRTWKGWVDLDRIDVEIDALSRRDPAQAERFFLNRVHAGEDVAYDLEAWANAAHPEIVVPDKALIAIGVDGARWQDALAIIGSTLDGYHQWPICILERPANAGPDYEHDLEYADACVIAAFERFEVGMILSDPQKIEHLTDRWKGRWGKERVGDFVTNLTSRKLGAAVGYHVASVASGDLSHDGDTVFSRHVANARRKLLPAQDDDGRNLFTLYKDRPHSPNKIDAAFAAVISAEARRACIALGMLDKVSRPNWFVGI